MSSQEALNQFTSQDILNTIDGNEENGVGLQGVQSDVQQTIIVNDDVLTVALNCSDGSHTYARFKLTPLND